MGLLPGGLFWWCSICAPAGLGCHSSVPSTVPQACLALREGWMA